MKSGLEMVLDVARLLNVPALRTAISGNVWQFQRPASSNKVDVVVNSLALTNQQLQQGVVNVNIHAPNRTNTFDGVSDSTMPDLPTLQSVGKIVTGILEANWQDTFHTEITDPGQPFQEGAHWYLNIRVNYYAFQDKYQNI